MVAHAVRIYSRSGWKFRQGATVMSQVFTHETRGPENNQSLALMKTGCGSMHLCPQCCGGGVGGEGHSRRPLASQSTWNGELQVQWGSVSNSKIKKNTENQTLASGAYTCTHMHTSGAHTQRSRGGSGSPLPKQWLLWPLRVRNKWQANCLSTWLTITDRFFCSFVFSIQ